MAILGIPSKVIDKITKELGLQTAVEPSLFDLKKDIQPIINVIPENLTNLVKEVFVVGTTVTLHTCDSVRDTYVNAIQLSYQSIAAIASSNVVSFTGTLESGETINFFTLAASSGVECPLTNSTISLNAPIKLQKGSIITLTRTTALDNTVNGVVYLREVD